MQQISVIEASEVREVLTRLHQAREQHCAIVADKARADLEAGRVASEIGQARAQLGNEEKALAISGELPEDAFPGEAQIARLERQQRVVRARVSAIQERVNASQNVIDDLKKQLDAAWLQFGVERCREVLTRFRQAALELRKVQCEHRAWLQSFINRPGIRSWPWARVMDPYGGQGYVEVDGCPIFEGRLVDTGMIGEESYWRPVAAELADAIQALHNEVEGAKNNE